MKTKTELYFREWLLLNEIGHIALPSQEFISLPNEDGERQMVPVHMCDPLFETYNAIGHRRNENDELVEYSWKEMINMNPVPGRNGEKPGIGWEGLIPFTNNVFFGCATREKYARIGPSRNLIRAPNDWYSHAFFIDKDGKTSYYAPQGIYQPQTAKAFS